MMSHNLRAFGWSLVLVSVAVATAMAHLAVTKTMPEADAVLAESPEQLQVWFTQDPDPAVSKLTLQGTDGEVVIGETVVADQKSLVAAVPTDLSPGRYTVSWRSAGDDGHVRRGDFVFTLRGTN
jgi:methionine-rich copper-binding protein CopC